MNAEERRFVIWNPDLRADVIYRDTEYLDFSLPRLVFGLRVLADGRVADCSMGVVADEPPTEDTPMFYYPFPMFTKTKGYAQAITSCRDTKSFQR